MILNNPQKLWLPYAVGLAGILLSIFLWFLLREDAERYFGLFPALEAYHPWFGLAFGVCFSILIAFTIRIAQLAEQRAITLDHMNEDLKKEIAERISSEETRQSLEAALLQGQKLQAIGTLAGGIAHDFNNILYAIIGYAEMSREDVDKESITYKNLGKVLEGAHKGQELVSRILAFSRRQHHHFDEINLKSTVESALSLLRPTVPASVIINFQAHTDPDMLGNQTQIHQVLINLINNAVDAMAEEGMITIKLEEVAENDAILQQFPSTKGKKFCKLEIIDTGQGMDASTMERIFEPFFTTKEVGKGTGLGLSIVHTIIKEHEGEITVRSKLGKGTTFIILLPIYTAL